MSNNKTVVSLLLDETGSMHRIFGDAVGSFNSFFEELKDEAESDFKVTVKKFNAKETSNLVEFVDLSEVPKLDKSNYYPQAGTPLVDATYSIIKETEKRLDLAADECDECGAVHEVDNVIVAVLTDGKENSSTEHTRDQLNDLIEEKQEEGWEFTFLGADIDAYEEAGKYGFKRANTMSIDRQNVTQGMSAMASNTASYASGDKEDLSYTDDQKQELDEEA